VELRRQTNRALTLQQAKNAPVGVEANSTDWRIFAF